MIDPACDPDGGSEASAELLVALLQRGPRTYSELRAAGLEGSTLQEAAAAATAAGRGTIHLGPWVELLGVAAPHA